MRNSVTFLLKPQNAATKDKRLVSKKGTAVQDIRVKLYRFSRRELFLLLHSPKVVYGGQLGLAADACANFNRASGGGWASLAGRYFFMGYWSEVVKVTIEEKRISIAFLKFYAFLYAAQLSLDINELVY